MPKVNIRTAARVERAVELYKKHPKLSVPQLMKISDFPTEDINDRAVRACIYRRIKKWTIIPREDAYKTPPPTTVVASRLPGTLSSVTASAESVTAPPQNVNRVRMTASAAQTMRAAKKMASESHKIAMKHATTVYAREKEKTDGKSAQYVVDLIQKEFKVNLSARTIQRKVKNGEIGTSPVRHGPKGSIPEFHYKNLLMAFESFVTICQLNGKARETVHKRLATRIRKVLHHDSTVPIGSEDRDFLKRVLKDTAINLKAGKSKNVEDRRIWWTTYKNLCLWFDNWEHDLIKLGFAHRDPITGQVCIPEDQLRNILNFDETCLSLDGSTTNRGRRPEAVVYNPRFPQLGKATTKSALTTTMITGSNAAGDPIPPHLQYQTKAKSTEQMKLHYDMAEHMPRVRGQFGCDGVRAWPVTFGSNEKGGMDEEEFEKYIMNSIVPLYPNARNRPGHRVMLKVDSGPGRMNLNLLARLRRLGFILYPCVPNTTHVTQETDQLYGAFKMQFLKNLDLMVDARLEANVSLSLQPKMVGLPTFGGIDRDTGYNVEVSAFEQGFSREKCLWSWRKVGAATDQGVTRACLLNKQVMRLIGDGGEDNDETLLCYSLQVANDNAVYALTQAGYDAQYLQATLIRKTTAEEDSERITVTEPNTVERVRALAEAKGHGGRFHVTHGSHVTHDDFFASSELRDRQDERVVMTRKKKLALQLQGAEEKALEIVAQGKPVEMLSVNELDSLLAWHQVPKKAGAKKPEKLEQWKAILADGRTPLPISRWTDDDEQRLLSVMSDEIDIKDTHYGRKLALNERELEASLDNMSKEKRQELRRKLDELDVEEQTASSEQYNITTLQAPGTASTDGETGAA